MSYARYHAVKLICWILRRIYPDTGDCVLFFRSTRAWSTTNPANSEPTSEKPAPEGTKKP